MRVRIPLDFMNVSLLSVLIVVWKSIVTGRSLNQTRSTVYVYLCVCVCVCVSLNVCILFIRRKNFPLRHNDNVKHITVESNKHNQLKPSYSNIHIY